MDVNFEGPKPELVRIPIVPVRRTTRNEKGEEVSELVPDAELGDDAVYQIRIGLLKLQPALEVEGMITRKLAAIMPLIKQLKGGAGDATQLEKLLTHEDLTYLARRMGPVCDIYNGVNPASGAERWIPLNDENQARAFGGGRMLAYNRWLLAALRVNFADFFAGLGLGASSKPGVPAFLATLIAQAQPPR